MRHTKTDRFGDCRMREQDLVNLTRRDFFAAAIDQLLEAADEREITVRVEEALIAGSEPFTEKRCRIRFGVVLVSPNDVWALNADLATFAGRQVLSVPIHD